MGLQCRKCDETEMFLQERGMQIGAYCKNCGAWVKWVGKKEIPLYKKRGAKVYPEGYNVELKNNGDLGVGESHLENMGVEISKNTSTENTKNKKIKLNEGVELPWENDTMDTDEIISKEVKKRVAAELERLEKEEKGGDDTKDYCPICAGLPIEMEEKSKVDMVLYSNVLTITDLSGVQVLGFWRLKYCPECGKKLNKGE